MVAPPDISPAQGLSNLLSNGSFETWEESAPTAWTLRGAGALAEADGGRADRQPRDCRLTRAGADARITQQVAGGILPVRALRGHLVTFSAWVVAEAGVRARIGIADGMGETGSTSPPSRGRFSLRSCSRTIALDASEIAAFCEVFAENGSATFAAARLTDGLDVPVLLGAG